MLYQGHALFHLTHVSCLVLVGALDAKVRYGSVVVGAGRFRQIVRPLAETVWTQVRVLAAPRWWCYDFGYG